MRKFTLEVEIKGRWMKFGCMAPDQRHAELQAQEWARKYEKTLDERGVAKKFFPPVAATRGA